MGSCWSANLHLTDMADDAKRVETKPCRTGPTIFYVMLGLILALLLTFLLLRPRGSQTSPPDQKKSFLIPAESETWS